MTSFNYPHITGNTPEEQLVQVKDYLYQLVEQLEFAFGDIDDENLSESTSGQLVEINQSLAEMRANMENAMRNTSLNARKVVNEALKETDEKISSTLNSLEFSIDLNTGQLSYTVGE